MSKVSIFATLTAADGKADELKVALHNVIAAAEEEGGLEVYAVFEDTGSPGVFHFFELYESGDALGVHGQGDGMKAAIGAFGGLLASAPTIAVAHPVAAKGLAL
jgi:quinol monooxygenase YgiN